MLGGMRIISLRLKVSVVLLALLGWPAVASANHGHIGGGSSSGGGGSDPNADCLAWGYILADGGAADAADAADADADAAMSDAGGGADAASPADAGDGGSGPPAGAVLVCLEHAKLFGCDCATSPAAGNGWPRGALALVAALLIASRRRRRGGPAGGTR